MRARPVQSKFAHELSSPANRLVLRAHADRHLDGEVAHQRGGDGRRFFGEPVEAFERQLVDDWIRFGRHVGRPRVSGQKRHFAEHDTGRVTEEPVRAHAALAADPHADLTARQQEDASPGFAVADDDIFCLVHAARQVRCQRLDIGRNEATQRLELVQRNLFVLMHVHV